MHKSRFETYIVCHKTLTQLKGCSMSPSWPSSSLCLGCEIPKCDISSNAKFLIIGRNESIRTRNWKCQHQNFTIQERLLSKVSLNLEVKISFGSYAVQIRNMCLIHLQCTQEVLQSFILSSFGRRLIPYYAVFALPICTRRCQGGEWPKTLFPGYFRPNIHISCSKISWYFLDFVH